MCARPRLRVSPGGAQDVQEGLLCVYGCRRGTSEASAGRSARLRESMWRLPTSTLNFVSLDNDLFCHDALSFEKHPQRFCKIAPLICSNDLATSYNQTQKKGKRDNFPVTPLDFCVLSIFHTRLAPANNNITLYFYAN